MNSYILLYFSLMIFYFLIPFLMSFIMLFYNMFISIEIPLINMFSFNIPISLMIDWISCLFLATVIFISSMIVMFSMYYIDKKEHKKFSLMLIMFIISMSILIMSDNLIFILLGWDGLGLSSYILVIYYQNYSSAASGSITLMSNRIGDIMILLSIALTTTSLNWNFQMNSEFSKMILLMLMVAAISKSAQFPFSAWLPAAMAAPTPISALVHSSTLVTAGVFLLLRIMNNIHPTSLMILTILSSFTAIYASMSANWEQDLKKIIALSTLSQIAMMMFAISMKSILLAFFHLIIHALFKSMMFLCAGILIHNSSYQDMRMMGLTSNMVPSTLSILGISSMALMGIPFMSGFFSKDSIMEFMLISKMNSSMAILMILSIGMTASYSSRMIQFSSKISLKSKSNTMFHLNKFAFLSITIMAPLSIFIGAMMMWMSSPLQIFMIPLSLKMTIPITLMMGFILGMSMKFKNLKFLKLGKTSISLWFLHILTSSTFYKSTKTMKTMYLNDNSWQEIYGPQNLFLINKKSSSSSLFIFSSSMFLIMIMLIIPFM